jgi:hypothetical protein
MKTIKETTYAVVGTAKATGIRKVIAGGFRSKESAEKRLNLEKNDKYLRGLFRYLKVAKEEYKPRREGSLGKTLSHEPRTGKSDDI